MNPTIGISNSFLAWAAGLCLCTLSAAQSPVPARTDGQVPAPHASVLRRAHGLIADGALLRGGGADYKVTCDDRGVEFTPALGRRADRNRPLRLDLASIRRGATDVLAAAPARPRLQDKTAIYDRGNGSVTERWEVRPEGVELSFAFSRPPPGAGDLAVRLRATTELTPQPDATTGGLRLAAADLGAVTIGAVTGIDARDRRAAGTVRLDGEEVVLSLPAAFVDSAAYPLVLDPLIGAEITASPGTFDDVNADVAYDTSNDVYLGVWQREWSASNVDLRAQRVDSTGALVGSELFLTTTDVTINPTAANVNASNRFLVCWQESTSVFGPWDIRGLCVDAATGALSTAITIGGTTANEIDPDAASETSSDDDATVVWSDSILGIVGESVTCPAGSGAPSAPYTTRIIDGWFPSAYRQPAISKSGGTGGAFLVVYEHTGSGLRGAAVGRSNANVLTPLHIFSSNAGDAEPDVDGDGVDFVIAFARPEAANPQYSDVVCKMVHYAAAAGTLTNSSGAIDVAAGAGDDEIMPAVGHLGAKYIVAWADEVGPFQYEIGARELDPLTCARCSPRHMLGTGGRAFNFDPQIATKRAGGSGSDECLLVFSSADDTPPFASQVMAQRLEAIGAGGAVVDVGGGCGRGGVAAGRGSFAIGNPAFSFVLSGADPGALAAALNLNAVVAPIRCGACLISPPLLTFAQPIAGGTAMMTIAVPCQPSLIGGMLQAQWYVVGGATPCNLAPRVSFSNRLDATVGL